MSDNKPLSFMRTAFAMVVGTFITGLVASALCDITGLKTSNEKQNIIYDQNEAIQESLKKLEEATLPDSLHTNFENPSFAPE